MRSRAYYRTRAVVRFVFWSAVIVAACYAVQFAILCVWALQF